MMILRWAEFRDLSRGGISNPSEFPITANWRKSKTRVIKIVITSTPRSNLKQKKGYNFTQKFSF